MQGPYFLAIDLGTSGPKVGLFSLSGHLLESHFTQLPLNLNGPSAEQDPNLWWEAVCKGIDTVLAKNTVPKNSIVSIGCTGQWSGTIAINKNGQPLTPAIIWMDSRGASSIHSLINSRGPKIEGYPPTKLFKWIHKTGGAPNKGGKDSLAHILYLKQQHPKIYAQTYKFLEPKDYLNFKLTGEIAASYDSITLHWVSDNRNLKKVDYADDLIRLCNLDKEKLPNLLPAQSILGKLKPSLQKRWQLKGIQVACNSPDIQAAAVGSGAVLDYQPHLCLGSSAWISCHLPHKKVDIRYKLATLPSALKDRYFLASEQESAGLCLDFWRKQLGDLSWDKCMHLASQAPPGSKNLIFTPWLNGERTPVEDHNVRGGFHNLSLQHDRSSILRAVCEGVAYNASWLLTCIRKFLKQPFKEISMIGGGAQNDLWCQIHADILNCQIKRLPSPRHAGARGAAWISAMTLNHLKVSDIPTICEYEKVFTPNPNNQQLHSTHFKEFLSIYRHSSQMNKRLRGTNHGLR